MLRIRLLVILGALLALASPASAGAASTSVVLVQGGTTISDSGLLANVIIPGFKKAFPQYTLQFVPVGTSQALINAENGQGDAVFTHNPGAEAQFVAGGYANEPFGRAVMYSDFVTVGAKSDPAGVLANAPNNAVQAFQRIAAAGAAGHASFVSRGDGSGTNLKELQIWALTNVPRNTLGEPGTPGTTQDASWYHKAGLGQAQTVQVADQCPFSGGGCYALVDRGTFNILLHQKTITNLKIVSQQNPAPAVGGPGLLINPYHAYAVKPGSTSRTINIAGATAFLNYLTSRSFQKAVSNYPPGLAAAFHPDAYPVITPSSTLPTSVPSGRNVTVTGNIKSALPFSPPLAGAPVNLIRKSNSAVVASGTLDASGDYSLTFTARRSDTYVISFPQYQDLRANSRILGALRVT